MKLNIKQIDELNELLIEHSEVLTAFYDEGINYGLKKGCIIGVIGGLLGVGVVYVVEKLKSHKNQSLSR